MHTAPALKAALFWITPRGAEAGNANWLVISIYSQAITFCFPLARAYAVDIVGQKWLKDNVGCWSCSMSGGEISSSMWQSMWYFYEELSVWCEIFVTTAFTLTGNILCDIQKHSMHAVPADLIRSLFTMHDQKFCWKKQKTVTEDSLQFRERRWFLASYESTT